MRNRGTSWQKSSPFVLTSARHSLALSLAPTYSPPLVLQYSCRVPSYSWVWGLWCVPLEESSLVREWLWTLCRFENTTCFNISDILVTDLPRFSGIGCNCGMYFTMRLLWCKIERGLFDLDSPPLFQNPLVIIKGDTQKYFGRGWVCLPPAFFYA